MPEDVWVCAIRKDERVEVSRTDRFVDRLVEELPRMYVVVGGRDDRLHKHSENPALRQGADLFRATNRILSICPVARAGERKSLDRREVSQHPTIRRPFPQP